MGGVMVVSQTELDDDLCPRIHVIVCSCAMIAIITFPDTSLTLIFIVSYSWVELSSRCLDPGHSRLWVRGGGPI